MYQNSITATRHIEPRFSDSDLRKFSLRQAILDAAQGGGNLRDSHEADMARTYAESLGATFNRQSQSGVMIPPAVFQNRALESGVAEEGGYLVGESVGPLVEALRPKTQVIRAGATVMTGLIGNLTLPTEKTVPSISWVGEEEEGSDGTEEFGQIIMTAKRAHCSLVFSQQLLHQTGGAVEQIVRRSILSAAGVGLDNAALNGVGSGNEPAGLYGATPSGTNSITFGGAPSWAKVVEFNTALNSDSVDGERAFVTSAEVAGKWQTVEKTSSTGRFLMEDGKANNFPVLDTSHTPSHKVAFGVWSELYIGIWGGLDMIVDPYTLAQTGRIRVILNLYADVAVRRPVAFALSTDAGNQ